MMRFEEVGGGGGVGSECIHAYTMWKDAMEAILPAWEGSTLLLVPCGQLEILMVLV